MPNEGALDALARQLKDADPAAIDLTLKISRLATEIENHARTSVAHLPAELRAIVLGAAARRLKEQRT